MYVSIVCLPRPSLYRPRYYFWHFFQTCTSHSSNSLWPTSTRAEEGWHSSETLSQSRAAGIWGSSLQFLQCAGSPLSLAPATLNSAFLLPASFRIQYRGGLCWAVNTDTHPWVYLHIHTFISHWKRQDQRRKEEQTPLRCWAWLHVPLDTDGRTQDNCCLLFMEGPSATLHALFIWRLLEGHSQEPRGKRTHCIYCMSLRVRQSWRMPLCLYVQQECTFIVQLGHH